uniref:PPPDE domain-containing protein n=1 Tax=Arcella intermedia TaxID=1963864 RepID=A0A6B2L591_9EUKA
MSVYDLNDLSTINNYTIRLGFGAFHCGVTVYGKEYSYAYPKGIFNIEPMKAEWIGKFRAAFHMGNIGITESEVRWIIAELRPEFNGQDYDILSHNCNHFCDALLVKLVHHHIPGSFNKLARFVQNFKGMLGDNFLVPDLNKDQQVNERINIFVSKLDEEEPVQSEDITPDLLNKLLEINRDLRTSTKTFEEIVSESCHDHDNDREGLLLPPPLPIPLLLTDMDENQGDQFGDLEDVFNQECSLKVSVPFSTSVDMQFKESSSMKHVKSTGSIPTTPKTTTFEPRRQSKTDFPVKQSATDTPKRYPLTAKLDPNLSRTRDLKAAVSVSEKKPKRAPREERKPGPPASASAITLTSPRGSKKALGGLEEKPVRKSKERKRLKPSKSSEYGTRRKLKEEGKGVEGMVKESHIL